MATVSTVTGEIPLSSLGITSMHEHVPLDRAGKYWNDSYQFAVRELKKAKKLGLDTIVEVSPRRDIEGLKRVSRESGVAIICCTGFLDYNDEEMKYSCSEFVAHMLHEIETGIGIEGIKPGIIKISADNDQIKDYEKRAFAAAAMVQNKTGLPICSHAIYACEKQQTILEDNGADLSKVYFSHVEAEFGWEGRSVEEQIDYLERVVNKGSSLSFNNFGNSFHTNPKNLAKILKTLILRGYSNRLLATIDTIWDYKQGKKREIWWEKVNADGKRRTYGYLLSDVVPWLRGIGILDADINRMIQENPLRLFE